jgi:hypothetical protein
MLAYLVVLIFYLSFFTTQVNAINILTKVKVSENSIFDFNKNIFKKMNVIKNNIEIDFKFKEKTGEKSQILKINAENSSHSQLSLHQGWLKYLEITENASEVPSIFIKNNVFHLQISENTGMNTQARDNIGYINIPNEDYFYFELTSSKLNVYSGRNSPYKKLTASLDLGDLIPQVSVLPCKGGVEDAGNFAEGYCFMLKFINFSKHIIWELCTDNIYEKDKWINKILDVNSKKGTNLINSTPIMQVSSGVTFGPAPHNPVVPVGFSPLPPVTPIGPPGLVHPVNSLTTITTPTGIVTQAMSPLNVVNPLTSLTPATPILPGVPIVHVWSPCSKPCGRGIQTRPLDCMDLNTCIGKKFEERLCNIQACKEDVEKHLNQLKKVADGGFALDANKLVISSTEMFSREMFDECKLLEGNLMMIVNNEKVLSHVEVNIQSIQIFSKNNPTVPIIIPISTLEDVRRSQVVPDCFSIASNTGNKIRLCPQIPQGNKILII